MAALEATGRPAPQAGPSARQAQEQSLAAVAAQQAPQQSARQAEVASMAALAAQQAPQVAPATNPAVSARQAEEQSMAALATLAQEQRAPVQAPVMAPALAPAREVATRTVAPVAPMAPMAPAQQMQAPTPNTPVGMNAIAGLFSAPAGSRANSAWGGGSFQSRGGGLVDFTNEHGYTRTLSPNDYSFPTNTRAPSQVAQERADRTAGRENGFLGIPQTDNRMANMARGVAGSMAGGVLGSAVAGPIGGLLGAALGKSLAQGQNPFGLGSRTGGLLAPGELTSALSGYTPGLGFPDAPSGGESSWGSPSYSDMTSISPGAAAAISEGRAGLY